MKLAARCSVVLCLAAVCGAVPAYADEPRPATLNKNQIAQLVQQLGDSAFKVRDAAQNKLLEYGVAIRPILLDLPAVENPEARRRLDQILKVFYQRELARVRILGVGYYSTNFGNLTTRSDVFAAAREMLAAQETKDVSPAKRFWELLDPFTKKTLEDKDTVKMLEEKPYVAGASATAAARKLHLDLRRAFEKLGDEPKLYEEKTFAKTKLPADVAALVRSKHKLSALEVRWLNYALMSLVFPDLLKTTGNSSANGIITISVPESTQPIILVLSAYESALWRIEAHPRSQLLQVIVGGYYPQEVIGAKVPVVYKVNQSLPGLQRNQDYFYCYSKNAASYQKMANHIQQLFGKGIDQFSGVQAYDGKPILIDPNQ